MLLFLPYVALLLLSLPLTASGVSTIHVDITTLITVTSCQSTVKECLRSNLQPSQLPQIHTTSSSVAIFTSSKCNADNCLRALRHHNAQEFCNTFTSSMNLETHLLPSYATQCTGSIIARVSSACTCLKAVSGSSAGKLSIVYHFVL